MRKAVFAAFHRVPAICYTFAVFGLSRGNAAGELSEKATKNGTQSYAERFRGRVADGHFREAQGLILSSLGIGTYLGQPDERTDAAYCSAIVTAVENGINVIDAAINYRFQRSERSVGAALVQLEEKGFSREKVILCSKAGYLTP